MEGADILGSGSYVTIAAKSYAEVVRGHEVKSEEHRKHFGLQGSFSKFKVALKQINGKESYPLFRVSARQVAYVMFRLPN